MLPKSIMRYTHLAHVIVDGLFGVTLAVYGALAALGDAVPANGTPAHVIVMVVGGLLVTSQLLRRASVVLGKVDPAPTSTDLSSTPVEGQG